MFKRFILVLMVLVSIGAVNMTSTARSEVVAFWQFEGTNFLADSSSNGHTLTIVGSAAQSSNVAVGTGSAYFPGASALTTTGIDLTGYKDVTVSWYQMLPNDIQSVGWALGPNTYAAGGGLCLNENEAVGGAYTPGTATVGGRDSDPVAWNASIDAFSIAHGAANTQWEHFKAVYTLNVSGSDTVKVYKDDVLVGSDSFAMNSMHSFSAFQDFSIGGVYGGTNIVYSPYTGYIDNLMIEGSPVPEPCSLILLATGVLGLVICAWRKSRSR